MPGCYGVGSAGGRPTTGAGPTAGAGGRRRRPVPRRGAGPAAGEPSASGGSPVPRRGAPLSPGGPSADGGSPPRGGSRPVGGKPSAGGGAPSPGGSLAVAGELAADGRGPSRDAGPARRRGAAPPSGGRSAGGGEPLCRRGAGNRRRRPVPRQGAGGQRPSRGASPYRGAGPPRRRGAARRRLTVSAQRSSRRPPRRRPRRLGSPASAATAAMASLRALARLLAHRDPADQLGRVQVLRRRRGGAPSTTTVISPRTPSAAHARQLGQRAAPDLLVRLGQLPAHRGAPVGAEHLGHRRERVVDPVRRLEVDQRAPVAGDLPQPAEPLARLARQEALEAEAVHRQPGQRPARSAPRTGPGTAVTRMSALDGRGHQPVAGVGDRRHPRVGHQQHPRARRPAPRPVPGCGRSRCPRSTTRPARRACTSERLRSAGAAAGCPRRRRRRRPPARRASRGGASARSPMGVPASTSTPVTGSVSPCPAAGARHGPAPRARRGRARAEFAADPVRPGRRRGSFPTMAR